MPVRRVYSAAMRAARNDHQWALDSVKAHRKKCSVCNVALKAAMPYKTCDEGWAWVKYERISAAQLRALEADEAASVPVQGRLW